MTLQNENKKNEKISSNLKFRTSKSNNIVGLKSDKNKKEKGKEKEQSKNNQINTHKNNKLNNNILKDTSIKKSKLKNVLNLKKNNNDIFIYDENKPITLTQEEISIYGDRTMKGYKKIKILGKGGYGVVWLCKKINFDGHNNMDYAVKQTSKKNSPAHIKEDVLQIAKNEIDILMKLNEYRNEKKMMKIRNVI